MVKNNLYRILKVFLLSFLYRVRLANAYHNWEHKNIPPEFIKPRVVPKKYTETAIKLGRKAPDLKALERKRELKPSTSAFDRFQEDEDINNERE